MFASATVPTPALISSLISDESARPGILNQELTFVPIKAKMSSMDATPRSPSALLISTEGAAYRLDKPEVVIGRAEECDIVINDGRASRRHARVVRHDDYLSVEDLASRNGTVVNHFRIVEPRILKDGDEIVIAGTTFKFLDPNSTMADTAAPTLEVKPDAREVRMHGRELDLTQKERSLIWLLYQSRGSVCTKYEIAQAVWPEYREVSDYNIEGLVSRLRSKLEDDPKNPQLLLTVRGVGYKLN